MNQSSIRRTLPGALLPLLLIGFFVAAHVFAQEPAGGDTPGASADRELRQEERDATREVRREERRAALTEHVQERVTALITHVVQRFEGAILRFEDIIGRLESRIEKLSDRDVETEAAEVALQDAKDNLGEAKAALEGLDSIHDVVAGDTPRDAYATLRGELRVIHGLLKETHTNLRNVIMHLKAALRDAETLRGVSSAVTDQAEKTDAEESQDEE